MLDQGVPTINTKNPIVFTANIEAIPRPVKKLSPLSFLEQTAN